MEEYLIYFGGAPCGSLRMEKKGLYTHFSACCGARQGRIYSLVLEGERGEMPLGVPDCYWKPEGSGRSLAVPIDDGRPFLLPRYFCFARIERLWGKAYAVFVFDEAGQPILP